MTKKAKRAIWRYINHMAETKMDGYRMAHLMFEWTLEAERMRRSDLYAYLEQQGYRWKAQWGEWEKLSKKS